MGITVTVEKSGSLDRVLPRGIVNEMYKYGTYEISKQQAESIYEKTIKPMREEVKAYNELFDRTFAEWANSDRTSVLSKMADAIQRPTKGQRREKIALRRKDIDNDMSNESTKEMMKVMQQGHSLLLKLRKDLTGQEITTKFIISCDGSTYEVSEKDIKIEYALSRFGAGTISNPVSLAYVMTKDILQDLIKQGKAKEISDKNGIWTTIYGLKRPYLDWKKEQYAQKGIEREYPNIFYDSKDAEIYELYSQQRGDMEPLTLERYIKLRQTMGGGGGYASPFYKKGDVGSVQVKYFNFKNGQAKTAVNFARFSLLRDQLRKLEDILFDNDIVSVTNRLIKFFTEDESRVSEKIDTIFNEKATEAILKALGWA